MIFDKLCGIAERHWPELTPYLERARIFEFPGRAHEVLPKTLQKFDWWADNFFLPFDVVAVEDTASCVILADMTPNQTGLSQDRIFIDCFPMDNGGVEFADDVEIKTAVSAIAVHAYIIVTGKIRYDAVEEDKYLISGHLDDGMFASKDEVLMSRDKFRMYSNDSQLIGPELRNAGTGIEELMYFNTPDRFVVEVNHGIPRHNAKKIPRSGERPRYILLKPAEIRAKMGQNIPEDHIRKSPIPHERRRHTKVLRSEKFRHKQGQTIIVPATWVGATEFTEGKTHYKVLLDL